MFIIAKILYDHPATGNLGGVFFASYLNATLRPFLYVHKGVTQGFLDLFQAYYNLRTRRWGPRRRTSAYQSLTGQPVDDWLTVLGFPSSATIH